MKFMTFTILIYHKPLAGQEKNSPKNFLKNPFKQLTEESGSAIILQKFAMPNRISEKACGLFLRIAVRICEPRKSGG